MKLFKRTAIIMFFTIMALVYVHQQVELVKLSYAIEHNEKRLRDVLDHRESLGYNINNLESPSRLEKILQSKRIDVAFPARGQVIRVAELRSGGKGRRHLETVGVERQINFFRVFEFFGLRAEAQAREK